MQKLTHIIVLLLLSVSGISQVATTKTENYKASFETKIDITQYMD